MKNLTRILALSLVLGLSLAVQAPQAVAEEDGLAPEVLPAAIAAASEPAALTSSQDAAAPDEALASPDPVFLAGTNAGGAGGVETGLLKGQSSGTAPTYVWYEDYWCCAMGSVCGCHYWPGKHCDPLPSGCAAKQPPNCG